MTEESRFNLIDEPWIPIANVGLVSLKQVFSHAEYVALGGNPIQKIALTKLLLAIAQSAYTPLDDRDWENLRPFGLAERCLDYLNRWHDRFYLYGDKPFLQIPAIRAAKIQPFGAVMPEISDGNTTVLTQSQVEKPLTDADKAVLVVQLMGFSLGGKQTDNSVVLSPGYAGKQKPTGKYGPSLGRLGFLHTLFQGQSLQETVWLNLFTRQAIEDIGAYRSGVGVAPWEQMPLGEDDAVANSLKTSLMGRLIPVSRFCLLVEEGLHYSEGIAYKDYQEGGVDPSISVDRTSKTFKAIWSDPDKRPWRSLTALLAFLSQTGSGGFDCYQLRLNMRRAAHNTSLIGVWSGGLRTKNPNAGEQKVSGSCDFVESLVHVSSDSINGSLWFSNLQIEMCEMETLSKIVYGATMGYFKSQNKEAKGQAAQASNLFWQLCEHRFQDLVYVCGINDDAEKTRSLRPIFAQFAYKAYDTYCAKDTARQIDAWGKNRPHFGKYLKNTREAV